MNNNLVANGVQLQRYGVSDHVAILQWDDQESPPIIHLHNGQCYTVSIPNQTPERLRGMNRQAWIDVVQKIDQILTEKNIWPAHNTIAPRNITYNVLINNEGVKLGDNAPMAHNDTTREPFNAMLTRINQGIVQPQPAAQPVPGAPNPPQQPGVPQAVAQAAAGPAQPIGNPAAEETVRQQVDSAVSKAIRGQGNLLSKLSALAAGALRGQILQTVSAVHSGISQVPLTQAIDRQLAERAADMAQEEMRNEASRLLTGNNFAVDTTKADLRRTYAGIPGAAGANQAVQTRLQQLLTSEAQLGALINSCVEDLRNPSALRKVRNAAGKVFGILKGFFNR